LFILPGIPAKYLEIEFTSVLINNINQILKKQTNSLEALDKISLSINTFFINPSLKIPECTPAKL